MAIVTRRSRQDRLNEAARLHERGDLAEAARRYERMLRDEPNAWQPAFLLGLLRNQQGDLVRAEPLLRRAVEGNDEHAEAWFYLGEVLSKSGRDGEAEQAWRRVARREPPHAMASFRLGLLCEGQGRRGEALAAYERALLARPDFPEALNNLSNLLRATGELDRAESLLRRAVAARPDFLAAYLNLARLCEIDRQAPAAAREALEAAVKACPGRAEAHCQLGALLARVGEVEAAVQQYERALIIDPGYPEAYNNVGIVFLEQGFFDEARTCFERALERQPALADAQYNLGNLHSQIEEYEAARASFERAIALRPSFAEPYNGLGIVLNELGDPNAAAAAFRKALELNGRFPEALANLGAALQRTGDLEGARHCYEDSLRLVPNIALQIKLATMVPAIAASAAELERSRQRFDAKLTELLTAGGNIREEDLLKYPAVGFFLAYHGQNDRPILEKMARLHTAVCPTLTYRASRPERAPVSGRPLRIGFVSRFFFNHSVGNFFNPIIEHLAEQPDFEVYLFGVGFRQDANVERVARACKGSILLSPLFLPAARTAIEHRELDILVYVDIGMDRFTYLLAFSRLAPVQCVLHGHSDTSGIPALDYFVSSRLLEPDNAQTQYSERLALLDTLPMYLRGLPPLAHIPDRAELGLPLDGRLYICPMKLHKVHPDMDALVASIVKQDPEARVLLFEDDKCPEWHEALRQRMDPLLQSYRARVEFLPFAADLNRFRAILSHAAVVLDTPHHGGGTTCNLAFSVGAPVVSLVGETCRGRGPLAYYTLMGIGLDTCIAHDADEYVRKALHIACNSTVRAELSREIVERRSRFAQNDAVFRAYSDLFRHLAAQPAGARR